jgi:hypothetical protein
LHQDAPDKGAFPTSRLVKRLEQAIALIEALTELASLISSYQIDIFTTSSHLAAIKTTVK